MGAPVGRRVQIADRLAEMTAFRVRLEVEQPDYIGGSQLRLGVHDAPELSL
jgi:hypothetical protein